MASSSHLSLHSSSSLKDDELEKVITEASEYFRDAANQLQGGDRERDNVNERKELEREREREFYLNDISSDSSSFLVESRDVTADVSLSSDSSLSPSLSLSPSHRSSSSSSRNMGAETRESGQERGKEKGGQTELPSSSLFSRYIQEFEESSSSTAGEVPFSLSHAPHTYFEDDDE